MLCFSQPYVVCNVKRIKQTRPCANAIVFPILEWIPAGKVHGFWCIYIVLIDYTLPTTHYDFTRNTEIRYVQGIVSDLTEVYQPCKVPEAGGAHPKRAPYPQTGQEYVHRLIHDEQLTKLLRVQGRVDLLQVMVIKRIKVRPLLCLLLIPLLLILKLLIPILLITISLLIYFIVLHHFVLSCGYSRSVLFIMLSCRWSYPGSDSFTAFELADWFEISWFLGFVWVVWFVLTFSRGISLHVAFTSASGFIAFSSSAEMNIMLFFSCSSFVILCISRWYHGQQHIMYAMVLYYSTSLLID